MGGLTRVLARLLRRSARLVPEGRRVWMEALWAEAGQVPAGRARLAWRAGGLRLIAREALPAAKALVFAAAAAWVAHAAMVQDGLGAALAVPGPAPVRGRRIQQ